MIVLSRLAFKKPRARLIKFFDQNFRIEWGDQARTIDVAWKPRILPSREKLTILEFFKWSDAFFHAKNSLLVYGFDSMNFPPTRIH